MNERRDHPSQNFWLDRRLPAVSVSMSGMTSRACGESKAGCAQTSGTPRTNQSFLIRLGRCGAVPLDLAIGQVFLQCGDLGGGDFSVFDIQGCQALALDQGRQVANVRVVALN